MNATYNLTPFIVLSRRDRVGRGLVYEALARQTECLEVNVTFVKPQTLKKHSGTAPVDGWAVWKSDRWQIDIADNLPTVREVNEFAHQLAHILCEHIAQEEADKTLPDAAQEAEADERALQLMQRWESLGLRA